MRTTKNLRRLRCLTLLMPLAVILTSCGDVKGYHSLDPACANNSADTQDNCPVTTIALAPANATLQTFGSVLLSGTVSGYTAQQTVTWRVLGPPVTQGLDCAYTQSTNATFANCPYGYVIYSASQPPYNAIYYAPGTPGTYQVGMQVYPADGNGITAFVTITVN
jgi:hypothetical protein